MSTISPGRLLNIEGVADPVAAIQDNAEALTQEIFKFVPSYQNGSQTALIGPPTSGAHILNERWKDANGAEYICSVDGTPGTWIQRAPAVMNGEPGSGSYPTGYQIIDTNDTFALKVHLGALAWRKTNAAFTAAPASASASGTVGQIAFDSSYAYFCVAANTWLRAPIATW